MERLHEYEREQVLPQLRAVLEEGQAAHSFAQDQLMTDVQQFWDMPAMHLRPKHLCEYTRARLQTAAWRPPLLPWQTCMQACCQQDCAPRCAIPTAGNRLSVQPMWPLVAQGVLLFAVCCSLKL